uniref:Uncharacterized protein n=1 Tax=Arundo donax TaxID=35708 RepID=A0A0A8XR04_ARUDO
MEIVCFTHPWLLLRDTSRLFSHKTKSKKENTMHNFFLFKLYVHAYMMCIEKYRFPQQPLKNGM